MRHNKLFLFLLAFPGAIIFFLLFGGVPSVILFFLFNFSGIDGGQVSALNSLLFLVSFELLTIFIQTLYIRMMGMFGVLFPWKGYNWWLPLVGGLLALGLVK